MAKNAGRPWTKGDNAMCASLHKEGFYVYYIAEELGRTNSAIECKLKSLGLSPYHEDESVLALCHSDDIDTKKELDKLKDKLDNIHNEENITMTTIETITFVNGKDVKECTHEDIIHAIKTNRGAINTLVELNEMEKSTKMAEQIKECEKAILELVKIYDNI